MTREQVDTLKEIEAAAIREHISKTGRTRGVNGYRYVVKPAHSMICFPKDIPEDAMPEITVTVEKRCTYETIQDRIAPYWKKIRRFNIDLLQVPGLKQIPAIANA